MSEKELEPTEVAKMLDEIVPLTSEVLAGKMLKKIEAHGTLTEEDQSQAREALDLIQKIKAEVARVKQKWQDEGSLPG